MVEIRAKICGLRTAGDMEAAAAAGAAYGGFVFFEKSPRHLTIDQAQGLLQTVPEGLATVALVVDANDAFLDALLKVCPFDMLQLHGHEPLARVTEIRARYGLPVMKAVGIADAGDLQAAFEYSLVADQILIDAKPPKDAVLPGGNGLAFDWRLVAQRRWLKPWMLAGGLTPENVGQAIALTNARQVDVSSGVESAPGVKDPAKIKAFVHAAMMQPNSGVPILR